MKTRGQLKACLFPVCKIRRSTLQERVNSELKIAEANPSNVKLFAEPLLPSPAYFKPAESTSIVTNDRTQLFSFSIGASRGDEKPKPQPSPTKVEKPKEEPVERLLGVTVLGKPKDDPPAADPDRKIIRTGDMEFEIDSFDKAKSVVKGLIAKLNGKGSVSTINSEKLANGKVRGSIVVRMIPEKLDDFILDLIRDLGKTGELRSQRISSQESPSNTPIPSAN